MSLQTFVIEYILFFHSILARFLELLTAQVRQSTSGEPCVLLVHIIELYMTELAGVGSAEVQVVAISTL